VSTLTPTCAPDAEPTIAAGPVQLWQDGNSPQPRVRVVANWNFSDYQENGHGIFSEPLNDLFGNGLIPSNNWGIGEPQLLYDQKEGDPSGYGRFIVVAQANDPTTQRAWITIATTYIPQGYFNGNFSINDCTYRVDANLQPDGSSTNEPRVGVTGDSVVIAANMWTFDGRFQYAKLWVLPKKNLYNVPYQDCNGRSPTVSFIQSGLQNADGSAAYAVIPAKSYNASSSVTYLVSASYNGGNALTLWTLDSRQPSLSPGVSVRTQPYSTPPPAPQAGTSASITTAGARLDNAVYQPSSGLWTVHTAGCTFAGDTVVRSCLKWYQLDPVTATTVQDSYFGYSTLYVYSPAVAVDRNGNAVYVFNASASNSYPGIVTAGRAGGDPKNTLQSGFWLKSGVNYYLRVGTHYNAPALRSSAEVDASIDNRFLVISAYAAGRYGTCRNGQANYDWATQVGVLSFTGAAQSRGDTAAPVITISVSPNNLWPPNDMMVPVTVSGKMTDTGSELSPSTATYEVTDEYGQVQPSGGVTLRPDGSYAFTVQLQASRNGDDANGRQYTVLVKVQNAAGNNGVASTVVTVPHDQGQLVGSRPHSAPAPIRTSTGSRRSPPSAKPE
jgi:hypothetical protein